MPFTFTFDVVINPIILGASLFAGVLAGYLFGRTKVRKTEAKLRKLEAELLMSHNETLESQKALVELESRLQNQTSPVIPMKLNAPTKETPKEKATNK
jgi:K+-sensing histidine kinase KdpD